MSPGPHRPSCLQGALGCSALPPGANCSPGCSALLPGVLCSPWALSAPPGCSVLPLVLSAHPWALSAPPGCSVLRPGTQRSPLGAQRSCRPGGDQPSSWVSMSSWPHSQFSVTNFSACTDSFLLTDEHTVVFSFLNKFIFSSLSSNY